MILTIVAPCVGYQDGEMKESGGTGQVGTAAGDGLVIDWGSVPIHASDSFTLPHRPYSRIQDTHSCHGTNSAADLGCPCTRGHIEA